MFSNSCNFRKFMLFFVYFNFLVKSGLHFKKKWLILKIIKREFKKRIWGGNKN